ncbi:HIT family protein [Halobacterium yunchengense]|uniref:HIT family protein n=1 Tax=Halobacterium yunchengense TaxID=3108497 RepID=UPI00300B826F
MEQVFAPWRIEWVERDDRNEGVDCVFCEFPERDDDREHLVVARSQRAFVMLNNYPYSPGHCMVVPREHTGDYTDLDAETLTEHARLKQATFDALEAAFGPDGFNAGLNLGGDAAGGSIDDHLHTHVVPRWSGDTNFMPVIGDTKVIVEALEASWDRVVEAFLDREDATEAASGAAVLDFD